MFAVVDLLFCSNLGHEYVVLKEALFESIVVGVSEHFITKIMLILSILINHRHLNQLLSCCEEQRLVS